jgi:hypothetical protein
LRNIPQFLAAGQTSYSAADVIGKLLSPQIPSLISVATLQTAPVAVPPRELRAPEAICLAR